MSSTLLTELVCTRLSHDIIGNIGAVANAVELLEEGDLDYIGDITSILKAGSQTLAARLKFFRMAFGINNANLEDESLVRQTAFDYLKTIGNKDFPILLEWNGIGIPQRKNALLLVMLAADVLIRGGQLKVYETNNGLSVEITAGTKISTDRLDKIKQALVNGQIPAEAALAPLAFLSQQGLLGLSQTEMSIIFTLRSK